MAIDVEVQAGLGRVFAGKFRAALGYAVFERTRDRATLADAVTAYRSARAAWAGIVEATESTYRELAFGTRITERGHWRDRLPPIDADLAAMEQRRRTEATNAVPVIQPTARPTLSHDEPTYRRGDELEIAVGTGEFAGQVELRYRHLHQGEDYRSVPMTRTSDGFAATIPGDYTDSPYPLAYYFVARAPTGDAWIAPGLDRTLANQPYHVIRHT